MPASWITAGVALYGAYSASQGDSGQSAGSAAADPFADQRDGYKAKLGELMTGEFKPEDPSYQWRFNQGLDAANRGSAASGMLRSGNRLAALQEYGQGQASAEFANQFSRLSQLSGANIGSPAAAGQIIAGNQASTAAYINQLGQQAAPYIKSWYEGTGSSTGSSSGSGFGGSSGGDNGSMDGADYGGFDSSMYA